MSSTGRLTLKLVFLLVPFGILTFVLLDDTGSGGIGGGGYDLSGLVYGSLLFVVIIIWLLWVLISYFISKNYHDKKLNLVLLITGVIALIAAWFITPRMF